MYEDRTLYYRGSHDTTWTSVGTNIITTHKLRYAGFEEEIPQPKVHKAEIIGGQDVDFTEQVGTMQYTNGTHTLRFLLYQDTEAQRITRLNALISALHGKRTDYRLSWLGATSSDSYFCGRFTLAVRHLTKLADLITVTIDREPIMYPASS